MNRCPSVQWTFEVIDEVLGHRAGLVAWAAQVEQYTHADLPNIPARYVWCIPEFNAGVLSLALVGQDSWEKSPKSLLIDLIKHDSIARHAHRFGLPNSHYVHLRR